MVKRRYFLSFLLLFAGLAVPAAAQQTRLYLFWSENCPICLFYGRELQHLQTRYGETVEWVFVFPNQLSTDSSAQAYLSKNKLKGRVEVEKAAMLVDLYNIEVTPEVVLLSERNVVLYAGRIDNSYEKIGRRRPKATATELSDRLQKVADKEDFPYIRTRAVGCFLHSDF